MKNEVLTLKKESAPANTNEASINTVIADKDFMKALGVTPEDIIKQVKISEKDFKEISDYVTNYKGTFAELYKELKGWNLGYASPEQDENNLFDCYYKSLLITVWVDEGVLKVSPNNVYVYPTNITKVDSDELFHLDFDKPIDYSKINTKVTESIKSLGHKSTYNIKKENKELLVEEDDLLGLKRYADELKTYIGINKNRPEVQTRQNELDGIVERLWVALEDVPFIEDKNRELILDGEYLDFPKGTTRDKIWHWFDDMYSKGVAYLINDFDITAHRKAESKKVTEDYKTNAINKTIVIEDTSGDMLMTFKVNTEGNLYSMENCDIADEEDSFIRLQQVDTYGEFNNLYNESKKVTEDVEEDLGEDFYEKICRAYIDTVNLEWVTTNPENYDSVVHGYFADDEDANKYKDKITPENFKDIAYKGYTEEEIENGAVDWYEYETWEDFYEDYVKGEIEYDINDIGVYSDGSTDYDEGINHWDFYISEEDLTKLGLWNEEMKSEFLDESKKVTEDVDNNTYTVNTYYIELPSGMFGITYKDKESAIKTFKDNLAREKKLGAEGSQHWKEHAEAYEKMIADGQVKVITITREIKETQTEEVLK